MLKIFLVRKRILKEKVHGFYIYIFFSLGSKKLMIFKKINIPFRKFSHSKDFFYHFFERNSNVVKEKKNERFF